MHHSEQPRRLPITNHSVYTITTFIVQAAKGEKLSVVPSICKAYESKQWLPREDIPTG